MGELRILADAALILQDGLIRWVGRTADLPALADAEVLDATGKTVLPGLVDSHTHLIWAGNREKEFEQRLEGKTYVVKDGDIMHILAST